jgi:hypothetical protein
MENTFNIKKFLAEGRLLKEEQESNMVDFLNQHKNEIIDAIGTNSSWITSEDISNAKKYYFFDEGTPGITTWYALTFNDDTMPNYKGYTDPRDSEGFANIYLSPNEDDFIKQFKYDFEIPEDEELPEDDEIPTIDSIDVAGKTLYYSNVEM